MKKIVVFMSLALLTSLAWADSGTRGENRLFNEPHDVTTVQNGNASGDPLPFVSSHGIPRK